MRWGLTVGVGSLVAAVLGVGGAVVAHVVAGDRESQPTAVVAAGGSPGSGVGSGCRSIRPGPDERRRRRNLLPRGSDGDARGGGSGGGASRGVVAVSRTREVFEAGAISRRDVIAEFASEAVRAGAGRRARRNRLCRCCSACASEGRAVDVTLTSQPVTAQAHAISAERIAVDVWTVSVFVAEGQAAAAEQWSTVHLEMVRESGPMAGRLVGDDARPVPGPGT